MRWEYEYMHRFNFIDIRIWMGNNYIHTSFFVAVQSVAFCARARASGPNMHAIPFQRKLILLVQTEWWHLHISIKWPFSNCRIHTTVLLMGFCSELEVLVCVVRMSFNEKLISARVLFASSQFHESILIIFCIITVGCERILNNMRCDAMKNSSPFVQLFIVFLLDLFVKFKTVLESVLYVWSSPQYAVIRYDIFRYDGAPHGKRQMNTEKPHWWTFLIIIHSLGGCRFPCDAQVEIKRQQQKLTTEQFAGAHSRSLHGNRLLCSYPFGQL